MIVKRIYYVLKKKNLDTFEAKYYLGMNCSFQSFFTTIDNAYVFNEHKDIVEFFQSESVEFSIKDFDIKKVTVTFTEEE
jgi:hypothetical protein